MNKVKSFLGSPKFFWGVIIFFVIEGLWVAFSAIYPMAFDEDFHFGIIKIYADNFWPFLPGQPENASQFSAVARDPSYLYHFLMSFPYRLIAVITHSETAQVIFLRVLNVGMFAASLLLFAKMFKRAGASQALANTALALFVLIPIVPLVAGQINYDNMFMIFTAWLCLLGQSLIDQLRQHKLEAKTVVWLLLVCMLGSLVKYAFLPLAFGAVVFLVVFGFVTNRKRLKKLLPVIKKSYQKTSNKAKLGLLALLALSGVLFFERYGLNLIQYHTPLPDCAAVLSVEDCQAYGPWERNYRFAKTKEPFNSSPVYYTTKEWLKGMHKRLFFVINGPHQGYTNYLPVPLPGKTFTAIGVLGLVVTAVLWRRVFGGSPGVLFLLVVPVVYVAVLWLNNYSEYIETGRAVAVNGRYLLPVLLPLAVVFGKGFSIALSRWPQIKTWAAVVSILLFIQAGGIFSYILRSDEKWYWPSQPVVQVNDSARKILAPIMVEGPKENK